MRAAPAKGHARQAGLTAGRHGHMAVTATGLGSALLDPEARPWGFGHLLILEQRESDREATPALASLLWLPSCPEEEGVSRLVCT